MCAWELWMLATAVTVYRWHLRYSLLRCTGVGDRQGEHEAIYQKEVNKMNVNIGDWVLWKSLRYPQRRGRFSVHWNLMSQLLPHISLSDNITHRHIHVDCCESSWMSKTLLHILLAFVIRLNWLLRSEYMICTNNGNHILPLANQLTWSDYHTGFLWIRSEARA